MYSSHFLVNSNKINISKNKKIYPKLKFIEIIEFILGYYLYFRFYTDLLNNYIVLSNYYKLLLKNFDY